MVDESLKFKLDDPSVDMAQKALGSGSQFQLWSSLSRNRFRDKGLFFGV